MLISGPGPISLSVLVRFFQGTAYTRCVKPRRALHKDGSSIRGILGLEGDVLCWTVARSGLRWLRTCVHVYIDTCSGIQDGD